MKDIPKNKTLLLLSIFIIIAFIGFVFIFIYQGWGDKLVGRYVEQISSCDQIQEENVCLERDYCEGIYGPSQDGGKNEFLKCQRISSEDLEAINKSLSLCEQTSGKWYENKFGKFCLCNTDLNAPKMVFNKEKGCVPK